MSHPQTTASTSKFVTKIIVLRLKKLQLVYAKGCNPLFSCICDSIVHNPEMLAPVSCAKFLLKLGKIDTSVIIND